MTKKYEEFIQKIDEKYIDICGKLAFVIFEINIKPILDKYKLELVTGNADYQIYATEQTPKDFIDTYCSKHRSRDLVFLYEDDWIMGNLGVYLALKSDYMRHPLGTIMPCYDPSKK